MFGSVKIACILIQACPEVGIPAIGPGGEECDDLSDQGVARRLPISQEKVAHPPRSTKGEDLYICTKRWIGFSVTSQRGSRQATTRSTEGSHLTFPPLGGMYLTDNARDVQGRRSVNFARERGAQFLCRAPCARALKPPCER